MTGRLIHTGQVLVDLVARVERLPVSGGEVTAENASFEVGGGFNVMAAARREGMPVIYAGGHGRGHFGDMVRATLSDAEIECVAAIDEHRDTGFCIALVERSAERSFITCDGAEVDGEGWFDLEDGERDYVYVSGYSLVQPTKCRRLLEWLPTIAETTSVIFDPGPLVGRIDPGALARVLSHASILSCNAPEARALAGVEEPQEMTRRLLADMPQGSVVVVRHGDDGCYLRDDHGHVHVPGFSVEAVDTNGAGDAHVGIFAAAMGRGMSLEGAARRANAGAAIAVTRWGPATAPSGSEIDAFLAIHASA